MQTEEKAENNQVQSLNPNEEELPQTKENNTNKTEIPEESYTLLEEKSENTNLENNSKPNKKLSCDKQKLSLEDFETVGSLGNGSFGEVSLVKKKGSEQYYAMKSINKNFLFKVKI